MPTTKKKVVAKKKPVARKVAARKPSVASGKTTSVRVGRFGSDPVTVVVKGSKATVGDVLERAGIALGRSERVWLNGTKASAADAVRTGDIVSVVSPKEAGKF